MGSLRSLKNPESIFGSIRPGLCGASEVSRREVFFRRFLKIHEEERADFLSKLPEARALKEYDLYSILRLRHNLTEWMTRMVSTGLSDEIALTMGKLLGLLPELATGYYLRMLDFRFFSIQPLCSGADTVVMADSDGFIKSRIWQAKKMPLCGYWGEDGTFKFPNAKPSLRTQEAVQQEYYSDFLLEVSSESLFAGISSITSAPLRTLTWSRSDVTLLEVLENCFGSVLRCSDGDYKFAIVSRDGSDYFNTQPGFLNLCPDREPGPFLSGLFPLSHGVVGVVQVPGYDLVDNTTIYLGTSDSDSWFDAPVILAPYLLCCIDKDSSLSVMAKIKVECVNPKRLLRLEVVG